MYLCCDSVILILLLRHSEVKNISVFKYIWNKRCLLAVQIFMWYVLDCISSHVNFGVRQLRPKDNVGNDFDGSIEPAAIDRCGVQEGVSRWLAIANAAKLLKAGNENLQIWMLSSIKIQQYRANELNFHVFPNTDQCISTLSPFC